MKSIGEFFAKIQNTQTKELLLRTIVKESIVAVVHIEAPIENISFKGRKAVIRGLSSVERSEIFLKRTAILKEIAARSPSRIIEDVA